MVLTAIEYEQNVRVSRYTRNILTSIDPLYGFQWLLIDLACLTPSKQLECTDWLLNSALRLELEALYEAL